MPDTKYFSHSWALLTRDKGWIKPILVLAVAALVPIVGPLAVLGYACEWARLSAWNVDAAPKQRGVKIGACIAAGWRAFVVILVWSLVCGIAISVATALVGALHVRLLSSLLSIAVALAELLLSLVIMAAVVRATIYSKISAGLSPTRIYEMVSRDASGLFKLIAIPLVTSLIVGGIGIVSAVVLLSLVSPDIVRIVYEVEYLSAMSGSDPSGLVSAVGSIIRTVLPACVIVSYASLLFSTAGSLLLVNSVGLWMRQFNVAAWGGPSDPLPILQPTLPAPVAPVPPQPAPSQPAQPVQPAPMPESQPAPDPTPAPQPVEPAAPTPTSPAPSTSAQPETAENGDVVVPLTPRPNRTDGEADHGESGE